jgi:hypothetical protein
MLFPEGEEAEIPIPSPPGREEGRVRGRVSGKRIDEWRR